MLQRPSNIIHISTYITPYYRYDDKCGKFIINSNYFICMYYIKIIYRINYGSNKQMGIEDLMGGEK